MKKFEIVTPVESLAYDELSSDDKKLIDIASEAAREAYAPYSGFYVGAAILLDDGTIITGNNQENAAFPSGMCAERTAAFYAHAQFPRLKFKKIAISAVGSNGKTLTEPISPCGACRQALLEYETIACEPVEILLHCPDKIYRIPSVRFLLPLSFSEIPNDATSSEDGLVKAVYSEEG